MLKEGVYWAEQYVETTDFTQWDWQTVFHMFEPLFQSKGFRETDTEGQLHILLIHINAMGDMVLATGFVREVRRNNPTAYITMLVSPAIYPLVCKCPYVNRILVIDAKMFYVDKQKFFSKLLQLCAENFWTERYALSICPQWGDDKTASHLVAYLSGAVRRVGYSCNVACVYGSVVKSDTMEKALMTEAYIIPADVIHEADRMLYILELLGMEVKDRHMEIWYGKRDKLAAGLFLSEALTSECTLIAVGLGAGGDSRKYPVNKYAEVLKVLSQKQKVCFVILGGKSEQQDADWLHSQLSECMICNLAGKTSVLETAAVLSMVNLYVGNDTGVMHMAAAVGVPVVMVSREIADYGGSVAGVLSENQRFAPWQTNYVICCPDKRVGECADWFGYGGCKEAYSHCICQVKTEEIVKAVELLLNKGKKDFLLNMD